MNLSLRRRIAISFIIANVVVLVMTSAVFYFLNSMNVNIEDITAQSSKISTLNDEIRISVVLLLKNQRKILTQKHGRSITVDKLKNRCEVFSSQLHRLGANFGKDSNVNNIVNRMLGQIDSIKVVLGKAIFYMRDRGDRSEGAVRIASTGDIADKILESFTELQDTLNKLSREGDEKIYVVINETKRLMMIILIIGFCAIILLNLVIPAKIALPFKKIKDAIRELQDCNFDVSIYYNQDDEIGEIAREMNKMIYSFKVFDELRTDRILVENRKFDALANMVKKPVLLSNAEGKLIYMNNKLYSLLQVQSVDVIGKDMSDTILPNSIIETFELAIKRRAKIENAEIIIPVKKSEKLEDAEEISDLLVLDEEAEEKSRQKDKELEPEKVKEPEEVIFSGYGNVIPIRGKDSSLDYYLMVLSIEIFS
ncbi:MAG: hypothetical protein KAQ98_11095 [Bacteriovoracaceae bacterium]|nr:hypothetical protein [Bacteriovoracaceae bacterium]